MTTVTPTKIFGQYDKDETLVPYYHKYMRNTELVAILPALPLDNPKCRKYYSVPTKLDKNNRVSPVFLYIEKNTELNKKWLFDTENLFNYIKVNNSYEAVQRPNTDELAQYIVDNPVVLIFMGCDDGHVGLRFKSKQDAVEYIEYLKVFEDVFNEKLLQYVN